MVFIEETTQQQGKNEQSLMGKYRIPIQHFEYSYIEKCKDGKELERILQILKSGEEGYFPDLQKFTEQRLSEIKPNSKLLRKICPVLTKDNLNKNERNQLEKDIEEWAKNMSKNDNELTIFKNHKTTLTLPQIRENHEKIIDTNKEHKQTKRISATDYSSWDKYDPDTEILKMDLEEENIKKQHQQKKENKPVKKTVQFKEFTTDTEALHHANYEKDKGNEFFKIGDYKTALKHYTNSINCKSTLASLTNRALTHIKLKNYKNAIDDCNSALRIEATNFKALLRKSQALDGLGHYNEALKIIEIAIKIDPNHTLAQELAMKLGQKCNKQTGAKIRLKIEEIENVLIPIPGTSKMPPPHYIVCPSNNFERIKIEMIKVNTPQLVHLISVNLPKEGEEEDDEDCTINHLRPSRRIPKIETIKTIINNNIMIEEDKRAGGEPHVNRDGDLMEMPDNIHSPYTFLKTWNSANVDGNLEQHAAILRNLNINRIVEVIGCKLDNTMFSTIIKCLSVHFAVPGEVERLHLILINIVNLPRFDIISMLMSKNDRNCVKILVDFLKQHGKSLPLHVLNKLL